MSDNVRIVFERARLLVLCYTGELARSSPKGGTVVTKTSFVLSIVLGLAIAATGTTTARAQELGEDEVALKNGGSIRGTVVAVAPGESVKIIEMGSTETRTIQWSEVAEVQKAMSKLPPTIPGGPPPLPQ